MRRERSEGYEVYPAARKDYNRDEDFYDYDFDIYESEFEHEQQYQEDGTNYDFGYGKGYEYPYEPRNIRLHQGVLRPKENRSGFFDSED
jgi:hypothetical protein